MNEAQRQVLEFHEAFELGAPGSLDEGNFPAELRIRLIEEEASEFAEAPVPAMLLARLTRSATFST